jgi:Cu-Zn family superoxide dismutase
VKRTTLLAALIAAAWVAGCAAPSTPVWSGPAAKAKLLPTKGNTATGAVTFSQKADKVVVTADVSGLKPNAEHGFHVHEKGDCSSGDGMSAGGHFNPTGKPHGDHAGGAHHAGDMPNLKADANGVATLVWEDTELTVTDGPNTVIGRSIVVHLNPDDYRSQPAGNAGPRIACGVIAKN